VPQLALHLEAKGADGLPIRYGVGRPGTFITRKISPIERWVLFQVTEGGSGPVREYATPEEALAWLRRQES
jgi:hypothetical protein